MTDAEQQVDEMIAEGKRIVDEAIAGYKPIAIVAAYSGGDDSIVTTHFAMQSIPGCVVFNADTLIGLGPTRDHIEYVCRKFGWPLEVVRAEARGKPATIPDDWWIEGASAYEEIVLNHGFGGPPFHPRMYQNLKEKPLCRLRRELQAGQRGRRVLVISGIRHDESSIRAGYKRAHADQPKLGVAWVNPFYWRTAADFEAYRQEFGLPQNPVKRRCGISGECCCGTFGGSAERQAYREIDPVFADYLDRLESRVRERFPWGWGESPPKWWREHKQGQAFLFEAFEGQSFQPMCVGCNNGRR